MNDMRKMFEMSRETHLLIIELKKLDVGDVMTYEQMKQVTGKEIQREHRGSLVTARKRIEQDEGIHFAVIRGVGVQRVTDAEAARSLERGITSLHRSALRHERRASTIDYERIPVDERAAHVARATFFGMIRKATSTKSRSKMLAAVQSHEESHKLDLKKALKALLP